MVSLFVAEYLIRMEHTMKDLTGKPAIPFNLRDSEGHTHHLENYKGNWLLMVFHRHLG